MGLPICSKNSGLACYSNNGLWIYLIKFSFNSCYSEVDQSVKLIARTDRFYESGMYFIRIFSGEGCLGLKLKR